MALCISTYIHKTYISWDKSPRKKHCHKEVKRSDCVYSNHAITPHRKHPTPSTHQVQLTVVKSDHVEGVHELSLVLVYPLHVSVKHGVWVDSNPVMLH